MLLQQAIDKRARELRTKRDIELADKLRNISCSPKKDNDVLVHNLSSKELTPEQLKVLSHEACFNTTDADPVNPVATVKSILKQTEESDKTKHLVRQQLPCNFESLPFTGGSFSLASGRDRFCLASASVVSALFKEIRQMSLLQTVPSSSEAKGHRDMQVSPEILAVVEDIK
ncbi:hypothetical protein SprV_0100045700 [Sparganum proliferum]